MWHGAGKSHHCWSGAVLALMRKAVSTGPFGSSGDGAGKSHQCWSGAVLHLMTRWASSQVKGLLPQKQ